MRRLRAGSSSSKALDRSSSRCGHASEFLAQRHPSQFVVAALKPLPSNHLLRPAIPGDTLLHCKCVLKHRFWSQGAAFSHRRMSLKTGVGAFCVAGAPFWFFGFDLGRGESSSGLWECGNRGAISKGGGKRRETWFWFSSFSTARHFHSPLPAVQHGVFADRKLANSFCLARCIRRAAAVSLSAWAMRPRASSVCPGLR